jgi:hypothetical protein
MSDFRSKTRARHGRAAASCRRMFALAFALLFASFVAVLVLPAAPSSSEGNSARYLRRGNGAPSGACRVGVSATDVYINSATGDTWTCKSADGNPTASGTWIKSGNVAAGAAVWGAITGTLSTQTDLQTALDAKPGLTASPTWTNPHIFSKNGAASTPTISLTGTMFSGGTATTTKPLFLIEPSGTTSTAWNTTGTALGVNAASGFTGNLLDLQAAGSSIFNVSAGNGAIFSQSVTSQSSMTAPYFNFTSKGYIEPVSDGVWKIENQAANDFGRLQFGGTTSSYPSLKRFGNALAFRTANDSVATFSTLTACSSGGEGSLSPVSDSTTVTWGATITGGGSNHVLAYCNGTNWTVMAK